MLEKNLENIMRDHVFLHNTDSIKNCVRKVDTFLGGANPGPNSLEDRFPFLLLEMMAVVIRLRNRPIEGSTSSATLFLNFENIER